MLLLLAACMRIPGLFLLHYGVPDGWSDFIYDHDVAALAAQGFYPNIQYWSEYPPLFPWLAVGAYRLSLLLPPAAQPTFWFESIVVLVVTVADLGSIVLVDRLGALYWGRAGGRRAATIYALLFGPAFASIAWYEPLAIFFLLLGLVAFVAARRYVFLGGMALGVGAMVKLLPLVGLVAAVVVARRRREKVSTSRTAPSRGEELVAHLRSFVLAGLGASLVILAIGAPLYALGRGMFLATFQNLLARGSWESPWALLDGYYGTGVVAAPHDRIFYAASASWGQPTRDPWLWWLAVGVGLAVLIWRGQRAARHGTPRAAIALTALAVSVMLLLLRGFSQQYIMWAMPFIVIVLPGLDGIVLALLLTIDSLVLEGYLYVTLFPDLHRLLIASVAIRTALLLWFAVEAGAAVDPKAAERLRMLRGAVQRPILAAAAVGTVVGVVLVAPSVAAAAITRSGSGPVVGALRALPAGAAVLFTQQAAYDRLYFASQPHRTVLVAEPGFQTWTGDRSLDHYLTQSIGSADVVALVQDPSDGDAPDEAPARQWLLARYGAGPAQTLGGTTVLEFRRDLRPLERALGTRFGDAIDLVGVSPTDLSAHPGKTLDLTLHWRAEARPAVDYTVSVQLLDSAGKLVAQRDAMPVNNTRPTSSWTSGDDVLDPIALPLPSGLSPGNYRLIAVLYDQPTGHRLTTQGNGAEGDHATVAPVSVS
jgi:hypothetical protein